MLSQEEQEELLDDIEEVLDSVNRYCIVCSEATPRNCPYDDCELFPYRFGNEEYEELSDEEWGRLQAKRTQEEKECEPEQAY